MPYIENNNRINTIQFIYGMADICRMVNQSSGKADSCIEILSLQDQSTQLASGANIDEIDVAISLIVDGGDEAEDINRFERMELVEKAIRDGETYASQDDMQKMRYLKAVMNGNSSDFLKDIRDLLHTEFWSYRLAYLVGI